MLPGAVIEVAPDHGTGDVIALSGSSTAPAVSNASSCAGFPAGTVLRYGFDLGRFGSLSLMLTESHASGLSTKDSNRTPVTTHRGMGSLHTAGVRKQFSERDL
jgi:hypothetical protein